MQGTETELDDNLKAKLASDSSELLYAYSRATGGWFIPAPPPAALGFPPHWHVPYDFTQFAITRSAVYWQGWEQREVTKKGLFGRTTTEQEWLKSACSISVSEIRRAIVSRDGFDPDYAKWPREQHLALDISGSSRSQTLYNWANNSADVLRDIAAIFAGLGIAVDDRAEVLSR